MTISLKRIARSLGLFRKDLFNVEGEETVKNDYRYFVCASRNGLCVQNLLQRLLKQVGDGKYVLQLSNLSYCSRRSLAKKLIKSGRYIPSKVESKQWILELDQRGLEIFGCRSSNESADLVAAVARTARRKLIHVSRNVVTNVELCHKFDNRGCFDYYDGNVVPSAAESKAA
jgi:hypothetical protein